MLFRSNQLYPQQMDRNWILNGELGSNAYFGGVLNFMQFVRHHQPDSEVPELGGGVADVEALLRVQPIEEWWRGAPVMARGGGARVSVSSGFRGAESEGERGESEGAVRGAREGGEGSDRGELARSLQRAEEDDRAHFSNRPLAKSFSFLSSPFPFYFCFSFVSFQ